MNIVTPREKPVKKGMWTHSYFTTLEMPVIVILTYSNTSDFLYHGTLLLVKYPLSKHLKGSSTILSQTYLCYNKLAFSISWWSRRPSKGAPPSWPTLLRIVPNFPRKSKNLWIGSRRRWTRLRFRIRLTFALCFTGIVGTTTSCSSTTTKATSTPWRSWTTSWWDTDASAWTWSVFVD